MKPGYYPQDVSCGAISREFATPITGPGYYPQAPTPPPRNLLENIVFGRDLANDDLFWAEAMASSERARRAYAVPRSRAANFGLLVGMRPVRSHAVVHHTSMGAPLADESSTSDWAQVTCTRCRALAPGTGERRYWTTVTSNTGTTWTAQYQLQPVPVPALSPIVHHRNQHCGTRQPRDQEARSWVGVTCHDCRQVGRHTNSYNVIVHHADFYAGHGDLDGSTNWMSRRWGVVTCRECQRSR